MIITDKVIRELQRRVDLSYEEAERYLRRAGGNIDMAESYARRKNSSLFNRIFREVEKMIDAMLIYRISIYKDEDHIMNMPILIFVILYFLIGVDKAIFVTVVFIVIALLADCNMKIHKVHRQEEFRFYKTVNKTESTESTSITPENESLIEETKEKDEKQEPSQDAEYNEMTIDK
ncbi:MAG: DUF4342 domain-containing protein [Vallitaleaceae bacterium]|nr:DUF4342 domain-containing protein [Vallitaleaceae bacterium]